MISYAQNFEDVMLWRALKHISNGFYIDVGAWSPDQDSVTRHFYEKGWHGINIEPNPTLLCEYQEKRPQDINLEYALSDKEGMAELYFLSNTGLSSLDPTVAQRHMTCTTAPSLVSVTTLSVIAEKYCKNQEVHFLKIDVEGLETHVLKGNDWKVLRPWIVVVESTEPMSQVENHHLWEYILLDAHYTFVYADGLNRFYIANEHMELKVFFNYPPNVFDDFVRFEEVKLQNQVQEVASQAKLQSEHLAEQLSRLHVYTKHLEKTYEDVMQSFSWKITKPLRTIKKFFTNLKKTI